MSLTEFDIIKRYFLDSSPDISVVEVGIGDDAAIVSHSPKTKLAVCTDTLVENVHFPAQTSARDIGYKSLAVNLSDLAAMGASPSWVTLALTLPEADETWLEAFCQGFSELAHQYHISLIGGDTTRGPLTITVQAAGEIHDNHYLTRSGAGQGDLIYVTGTLGDAGAGLDCIQNRLNTNDNNREYLISRLNRPTPRIAEGLLLNKIASSCIDISDGVLADLNHILEASCAGATVDISRLPLSPALSTSAPDNAMKYALTSGDDYELCFTIPPERQQDIEKLFSEKSETAITRIGTVTKEKNLRLFENEKEIFPDLSYGYRHF